MSVESAADRAAFLSVDEWGMAAIFTPIGSAAIALTCLLDEPHQIADLGGLGVNAVSYRATLRDDDLAAVPRKGDTLAVAGLTFKVMQADQDIDGALWFLDLAKS